jgi:hypothetical protein
MNRSLATALELLAYGGSGPRVCHLNDYESIMAAWRTCEVIGGAPGATKSDDQGFNSWWRPRMASGRRTGWIRGLADHRHAASRSMPSLLPLRVQLLGG